MASKRNPPKAGMVWRKGYTRANGTRVKGSWVKNPGKRRTARRNPPRRRRAAPQSNPRRRRRRRTTAPRRRRRRRNTVYRGRRNPRTRTRTRTVVKYRYRNPRPRRRRARRNPSRGAGSGVFSGKWNLKKNLKLVAMNEFLFGGAGLLAASLGPSYLQNTTGKDFTSGHRDWLWSGVFALGGGMFIGKTFGAREGRAFAIAGAAVVAVKMLRAFTGGQFSLPLVGAHQGASQLGLGGALANASFTGGNLGMVEEVYPGQINKFYTPALDSPFVVQTT